MGRTSRILAVALLCLFGGALYLWLQPSDPRTTPVEAGVTGDQPGRRAVEQPLTLAVSWQPAFCETRPDRAECRSMTDERFDAGHFSLHGLWPEPEYCSIEASLEDLDRRGRWSELPALNLRDETRRTLDEVMPGSRSLLDRHEWIKHGTCFGTDEEAYFAASIRLLAALNASPVRNLFAERIGRRITGSAVRDAFDSAFGTGAGERVRLVCDEDEERRLIVELTIGLFGDADREADLGNLILAADQTNAGCGSGIVDPPGLQ